MGGSVVRRPARYVYASVGFLRRTAEDSDSMVGRCLACACSCCCRCLSRCVEPLTHDMYMDAAIYGHNFREAVRHMGMILKDRSTNVSEMTRTLHIFKGGGLVFFTAFGVITSYLLW